MTVMRPVTVQELQGIIREHLAGVTGWSRDEIEIRSLGNLNGIEVPTGDVSLQVPAKTPISSSRNLLLPIDVLQGGRRLRTFWVSAEVVVRAFVLEAAQRLSYGHALSTEDVRAVHAEIGDLRANYLRNPEEAVGRVLRRSLTPGDPLIRDYLTDPTLVRSGETVRLRLERDGIRINTWARAEQSGVLGQWIRVRNLEFSSALKARVAGRGEVRID